MIDLFKKLQASRFGKQPAVDIFIKMTSTSHDFESLFQMAQQALDAVDILYPQKTLGSVRRRGELLGIKAITALRVGKDPAPFLTELKKLVANDPEGLVDYAYVASQLGYDPDPIIRQGFEVIQNVSGAPHIPAVDRRRFHLTDMALRLVQKGFLYQADSAIRTLQEGCTDSITHSDVIHLLTKIAVALANSVTRV